MSSGTAALAYSIWLGKRKGYGTAALSYQVQIAPRPLVLITAR